MKIKALIVDDERLARSRLLRLLKKYDSIEIAGEASDGREAIDLMKATDPDVLFLDIKMPVLSGFEMLEKLDKSVSPHIIFTTAYDSYALRAFEENTIDYLLKPVSEKKLDRAVSKLKMFMQSGLSLPFNFEKLIDTLKQQDALIRRFSVTAGDRILIVPEDQIHFIKAEDKYTFIHTDDKEHIIPFTLKELEPRLDPEKFIRVHRAYIINLGQIASIHRWFGGRLLLKMKNQQEITVSLSYASAFKQKINM
ncbi:MAG: response regulator transcription factor [Candidatus Aminicenantes bacterium]|nr:response regulator transcription factor [Candidatus Aminicenantes bacterium]